jgi:5'-phosphate synthase pdxT subunit
LTASHPAPSIGVLAIQGDYEAHAAALEESGAVPSLVKTPEALESIDALILPGGESTTMLRFLDRGNFFEALKVFARQKPLFGTCAGTILLAREVRNPSQRSLGLLDITVERNAYGAQRDSAILTLETKLPPLREKISLEAVFIRAPRIVATGSGVEILAEREGFPVLVLQKSGPESGQAPILAATFHPELSAGRRVHQLFVELVNVAKNQTTQP